MLSAILFPGSVAAPSRPIAVRYSEGVTHGFLVLRDLENKVIAQGDLLQSVHPGDTVETRMVFQFKDGSELDETVRYTQQGTFRMHRYHLVQRGPSFTQDGEFELSRPGASYRTVIKDHKSGKEERKEGSLDLPDDTYNGMVMLVVKNFEKGAVERVHYVAFTPQPRVIELEYHPMSREKVSPSDLPGVMLRYRIKPQLGTFLKVMSSLTGKTPPDMYAWVIGETVPAFVRFEGPLETGGPIWIIETTSPRTETLKG